MGAEARLAELGIELPPGSEPVANYRMAVRTGDLLFVAGHGPAHGDGVKAREAARLVGVNLLATVRRELGSLDSVRRVVKVLGMVNCAPGFDQTPAVIDGCSDFLVEVFGPEVGTHARSAVGMAELPFGLAIEIEMIVEVA
jgi:enamine deaminase RidA (YjgF/YER057c/UK114 family)